MWSGGGSATIRRGPAAPSSPASVQTRACPLRAESSLATSVFIALLLRPGTSLCSTGASLLASARAPHPGRIRPCHRSVGDETGRPVWRIPRLCHTKRHTAALSQSANHPDRLTRPHRGRNARVGQRVRGLRTPSRCWLHVERAAVPIAVVMPPRAGERVVGVGGELGQSSVPLAGSVFDTLGPPTVNHRSGANGAVYRCLQTILSCHRRRSGLTGFARGYAHLLPEPRSLVQSAPLPS